MNAFLDKLSNVFSLRECDGGVMISTPIMYQGADHGFSFFVEKSRNGFSINDRGQTIEYLRENLDPGRYEDRITTICERFEITLEDGVFYGRLASLESGQTMRNLFKFIGVMNMIANIDTF
ncbi:MAG: DUF1828 domain-containing protein [Clostridia bacterium]|nr:DUF1828 domain-containing protein [Clostridia bacterium]